MGSQLLPPLPPPLLPRRADIYEDVPKIIIMALAFQAAAICVMIAFVALHTLHPVHNTPSHQPPPPTPIYSSSSNQERWEKVHLRVCLSPGRCEKMFQYEAVCADALLIFWSVSITAFDWGNSWPSSSQPSYHDIFIFNSIIFKMWRETNGINNFSWEWSVK